MDLHNQKKIQEHFETLYRKGFKPWTKHGFETSLEDFFKMLKERCPKAKILDVGCGDGWISIHAAKEGHEAWGIDSSPTAVGEAKLVSIKEGSKDLTHFEIGDIFDLPYEDAFFDAVVDRGLFHHVLPENRPLYFENVLRVFKPNALMYLSVFSDKNPQGIGQLFTREQVEELFGKYFDIVYFAEDPYPTPAPSHLIHFIMERKY